MANGVQYIPGGGPGPVTTWQGLYAGYIAVNVDPLDQGRVKLRVPQVFGGVTSGWASPNVPVTFIPKVGTAVTVMFVGGDPARPVWSGNFAVAGTPPVVIGSGTPTAPGTQVGEIFYDSANGMKTYEWNGASWIAYQIGTGGVAAGIGLTEPSITGGIITGAQFIADGTSGQILGYSGTPATGNMNVSVSPVAGTDGHTNAYLDGVTVYSGKAHLQLSVNAAVDAPAVGMTTDASSESGTAALYTFPPGEGTATESMISWLQGPSSTYDHVSAAVVLQSAAKDGSTKAYGGLIFNGGTAATWDATGFHVNGPLTASNVLAPDTWHTMTLQNGWTVASGGIARYKLMPDNTVMVHCSNLTPGNLSDATAFWFIPTGYVPASSATQNFAAAWGVGTSAAPSFKANPNVYTRSNGLYISNFPTTTVGISFVIRYALD